MGKRKYSYIIYRDGKKERIHNWYTPSYDPKDMTILVFVNSGAYLFRKIDYHEELICSPPINKYTPFKKDYEFLKLKDGVHNIDMYDKDLWYVVDNIERFEIITNFE